MRTTMGRVSIKFLIIFKTKGTISLQSSNEIKLFTICNQKYLKERTYDAS